MYGGGDDDDDDDNNNKCGIFYSFFGVREFESPSEN